MPDAPFSRSRVYLVMRTHFWSPLVERTANEWWRLFGDNVLILADETRGEVRTGAFRKISSTLDRQEAMGLISYPTRESSNVRNGDYGIYYADAQIRDYDFLFVAEYDVFPKITHLEKWTAFLNRAAEHDIAALRMNISPERWKWYSQLPPYYAEPAAALVVLCGVRPHVAKHLFQTRLDHARRQAAEGIAEWPHNEGFVGSEIRQNPSWRFYDFRASLIYQTGSFTANEPLLEHALDRYPGVDALFHPVVDGPRYVTKLRRLMRKQPISKRGFDSIRQKMADAATVVDDKNAAKLLREARDHFNDPRAEILVTEFKRLREQGTAIGTPAAMPLKPKPLKPKAQDSDFVFIVSYGRSGSTLLAQILNSIPGYRIRGENGNVLFGLFKAERALALASQNVKKRPDFQPWDGAKQIRSARFLSRCIRAFVEDVLRPEPGDRVIGFKEVRYFEEPKSFEGFTAFLLRCFPRSRLVLNTRNPADVAKSKWWAKTRGAEARIAGFNERLRQLSVAEPERTYLVSYDAYLEDPAALEGLFNWLGEPFDPAQVAAIMAARNYA